MSQRRCKPVASFPMAASFAAILVLTSGCPRSSALDALDAGEDVRDLDSATPFDAARDASVDARLVDAEQDAEPLDAQVPCPEPTTIESFHPAEDETRYGRALALSGDGSTLAVSSQDSLSIYDRDVEGEWQQVYRQTVFLTGPGVYQPGGVDIDDSGETIIWGNSVSTEASPDYSAALVFERETGGEWRVATIERDPETLVGDPGVSISGDGRTLAIREDGGGGGVQLRIFERGESGDWVETHTIVHPSFESSVDAAAALSTAGDRVAWHSSGLGWIAVHRREASGEWTLEFEVPVAGPRFPDLDGGGERLVFRTTGPDALVVYDRAGTTWTESARFPLPEPATEVPAYVAVSPSGDAIYASNATECGVAVWSWTQRDGSWTEEPPRYAGVEEASPIRFPLGVAADGTVALSVPGRTGGGPASEAVGVYLFR